MHSCKVPAKHADAHTMSQIPRKHRRTGRRRQRHRGEQQRDEFYWANELERLLNRFHASVCDLPELNSSSAQSDSQYRYAVRAREMFLVERIREFVKAGDEEAAAQVVWDLLTKAMQFTDALGWILINRRWHRRRCPQE